MKSIFNFKIVLIVFALIWSVAAQAGSKQEYTKTIKKDFAISTDGNVNINNKYGTVDIKTWDKSRIKIEVTITANSKSESEANEVFEKIRVEFENRADFVSAKTIIGKNESSWKWMLEKVKMDFSIDYEVFMPISCKLDLINRYGDTFVASINGPANIQVSYGNLQLESVNNDLMLNLNYGKGTVLHTKDMTCDVGYCQLTIREAENVEITSKYSKINIDDAVKIRSISKYDAYKLGTVKNFISQGKYDNISIGTVNDISLSSRYVDVLIQNVIKNADFDLKYGGVSIKNVKDGFEKINLNGSYTDFKIKVDENSKFNIDANTNFAGIRYPETMKIVDEVEKGTSHKLKAYRGSQSAPSAIKAKLTYGGLKVH